MNHREEMQLKALERLLETLRSHVQESQIQRWNRDITMIGHKADHRAIAALFSALSDEERQALIRLGERQGTLLEVGQRLYLRPEGEAVGYRMIDITRAYREAQRRVQKTETRAQSRASGSAALGQEVPQGPFPRVGRRMNDPLPSPQRIARALESVSTLEPRPTKASGRKRKAHTSLNQGEVLARRRQQREAIAAERRGAGLKGRQGPPLRGKLPRPQADGPEALKDDDLLRALEERLAEQQQRAQEDHDDRVF